MTDTCQHLPTRGCMAAHQFAAESPCADHRARKVISGPRNVRCDALERRPLPPPSPSRWPMQLRRVVTIDGKRIET